MLCVYVVCVCVILFENVSECVFVCACVVVVRVVVSIMYSSTFLCVLVFVISIFLLFYINLFDFSPAKKKDTN